MSTATTQSGFLRTIHRWIDSEAGIEDYVMSSKMGVDWVRIIPFISLHAACIAVVFVGWSWIALGVAT